MNILRSDGIGREFLKIDAGGSMLPTSEETIKNGSNILYIKKVKLFLNMLFLIWLMFLKKC